ncbi:MAG: hypothetical protein AABW51_02950 [Nanoarchaeota archaeon]
MNDNDLTNVQGLESIVVNGNFKNGNNRGFFKKRTRRTVAWLHNYRNKGPWQKRIAGVVASSYIGVLGPKEQRRYARKWGVEDAYFTKRSTTFWYGVSLLCEHLPIFTASHMLDIKADISEGNYFALANLAGSTIQNTIRAFSAFVLKKPQPVYISVVYNPLQIAHYAGKKIMGRKGKQVI